MIPWYVLKVRGEVVAETRLFSEVLVWSHVYLEWGLEDVTIFCTVKEDEE